jgi:hypothetical protein
VHVTAAEAALGAAGVTALVGLVVQHAAGSKDHLARLWERQAEVYEAILNAAHRADSERNTAMTFLARPHLSVQEIQEFATQTIAAWAPEDNSVLEVKLLMFGSPQVTDIFTRYARSNTAWREALKILAKDDSGAYMSLRDTSKPYSLGELFDLQTTHVDSERASKQLLQRIQQETREQPRRRVVPLRKRLYRRYRLAAISIQLERRGVLRIWDRILPPNPGLQASGEERQAIFRAILKRSETGPQKDEEPPGQ